MNTIWSECVQGAKTLYYSRKLRFGDLFAEQFKKLLKLDGRRKLKILEIGCGPGALAGELRRWYPKADICGLDRDSNFINFARAHEEGINFIEGDATSLPFNDDTFDVTISYTVSEHIEPDKFYGEQLRVLKQGGTCIVLSTRKTVYVNAPCLDEQESERIFWEKVKNCDDTMEKYGIGRYHMSEAELPAAMEKYGFRNIETGFAAVALTPDNPQIPEELACNMINEQRQTALDALSNVMNSMPGQIAAAEVEEMVGITNKKYDARIAQYIRGEKQWDTAVSVIMSVRGTK